MKWVRASATLTFGLALGIVALLLLTRSATLITVEAQTTWPPIHKNLSVSSADSTNADIEAVRLGNGKKVVAVVWMEGKSDIEILGTIKMRWKFEGQTGTWRISSSQMFPAQSGYAYGYPALALYPAQNSVDAHVVWFQKDPSNNQQVVYRKCTLSETLATCGAIETLSFQNSTAPDVAVDGNGIPHVVWQGKSGDFDAIYYNNRVGGNWGIPWAIQTRQGVGVDYLRALGQSPKIAVYGSSTISGSVVAVAWDREIGPGGTNEPPGLFNSYIGTWFARRDTLSAVNTGDTEAARWDLTPISQPGGGSIPPEIRDSRPRLAVGQTGIYLLWDRLISQSQGAFVWTRTYDVAYRVFLPPYTATVKTSWWPGPEAIPSTYPYLPSYQAPYSATTYVPKDVAGTDQDLYSGSRPTAQIAPSGGSDQLHIAWQRSAGIQGMSLNESADLWTSGEEDVNDYPLRVWHAVATHTLSSGNMSVSPWVSQQITVQQPVNGFFANPDLAVIPNDGPPHPHVALLDRFKTTNAYAWDVWYVNDEEFFTADRDPNIYLPIVLKNYY